MLKFGGLSTLVELCSSVEPTELSVEKTAKHSLISSEAESLKNPTESPNATAEEATKGNKEEAMM